MAAVVSADPDTNGCGSVGMDTCGGIVGSYWNTLSQDIRRCTPGDVPLWRGWDGRGFLYGDAVFRNPAVFQEMERFVDVVPVLFVFVVNRDALDGKESGAGGVGVAEQDAVDWVRDVLDRKANGALLVFSLCWWPS